MCADVNAQEENGEQEADKEEDEEEEEGRRKRKRRRKERRKPVVRKMSERKMRRLRQLWAHGQVKMMRIRMSTPRSPRTLRMTRQQKRKS